MIKNNLPGALYETLKILGGKATILEVCKKFWSTYEDQLRKSGDLFYTWQYDIRWAATYLRKQNKMIGADISPRGYWELKN